MSFYTFFISLYVDIFQLQQNDMVIHRSINYLKAENQFLFVLAIYTSKRACALNYKLDCI